MRIHRKSYLRMEIELASSLSIGSGENANTDHDILVDAMGVPFIPGTAIAGVTRHALVDAGYLNEQTEEQFFGSAATETSQADSSIVTYDVRFERSQSQVTTRDMVALDDYKTGRDGAKFDMEALEPGIKAIVLIEQNLTAETDEAANKESILPQIHYVWNNGLVRLGAKTTRGYGAIKVVKAQQATYDLAKKADITDWLQFPEIPQSRWGSVSEAPRPSVNEMRLVLGLRQVGGISIRRYTTEVSKDPDKKVPDYAQMTYAQNGPMKGDPVIPGTSWAGAFRHRVEEFTNHGITKAWFGDVSKEGGKTRADILFSESRITGTQPKEFTRCAINRFTAGASDGALYTERTYYNGETVLTITLRNDEENAGSEREFHNALAAAVVDLHEGILAVGGETSIGRGLFKVTTVNGETAKDDAKGLYDQVRKALGEEVQA